MLISSKHLILAAVTAFFAVTAPLAHAKVRVVTSLSTFADLAREVGGDDVEVIALSKGTQDPHFVDPKPDLALKLNRADLLIHNGLSLEVGWLPVLVTGARNAKVLPAATGHLDASTVVDIKGIPQGKIDRTMGDVHPGGNPHYMLDPGNGIVVSQAIAAKLKIIDPSHAKQYDERTAAYVKKLRTKITQWKTALAPYKGTSIVPYHDSWLYFTEWAALHEAGFVEPKPGIVPSPQHVSALVARIKDKKVKLVIAQTYYPHDMAELVAQKAGAMFLELPSDVGAEQGAETYIGLFDTIVKKLTGALGKGR